MTDLQDANLPKGSSIITGLILTNKLQLNLYKEGSLIEKMKNDNMTIIAIYLHCDIILLILKRMLCKKYKKLRV